MCSVLINMTSDLPHCPLTHICSLHTRYCSRNSLIFTIVNVPYTLVITHYTPHYTPAIGTILVYTHYLVVIVYYPHFFTTHSLLFTTYIFNIYNLIIFTNILINIHYTLIKNTFTPTCSLLFICRVVMLNNTTYKTRPRLHGTTELLLQKHC